MVADLAELEGSCLSVLTTLRRSEHCAAHGKHDRSDGSRAPSRKDHVSALPCAVYNRERLVQTVLQSEAERLLQQVRNGRSMMTQLAHCMQDVSQPLPQSVRDTVASLAMGQLPAAFGSNQGTARRAAEEVQKAASVGVDTPGCALKPKPLSRWLRQLQTRTQHLQDAARVGTISVCDPSCMAQPDAIVSIAERIMATDCRTPLHLITVAASLVSQDAEPSSQPSDQVRTRAAFVIGMSCPLVLSRQTHVYMSRMHPGGEFSCKEPLCRGTSTWAATARQRRRQAADVGVLASGETTSSK